MSDETVTERAEAIWTGALEKVLHCVPPEICQRVLSVLLEREQEREPFKVICASDFVAAADFGHWHAEMEAASLIIQVLARSITNNHSKEDAAKILFREHHNGTGSGWLPDYLDGLPGIKVNKRTCVTIADSAGPSKLRCRDGAPG